MSDKKEHENDLGASLGSDAPALPAITEPHPTCRDCLHFVPSGCLHPAMVAVSYSSVYFNPPGEDFSCSFLKERAHPERLAATEAAPVGSESARRNDSASPSPREGAHPTTERLQELIDRLAWHGGEALDLGKDISTLEDVRNALRISSQPLPDAPGGAEARSETVEQAPDLF